MKGKPDIFEKEKERKSELAVERDIGNQKKKKGGGRQWRKGRKDSERDKKKRVRYRRIRSPPRWGLAIYLLVANTKSRVGDSEIRFHDDKIVFRICKNRLGRFVLCDTMLRSLPRGLSYLGPVFVNILCQFHGAYIDRLCLCIHLCI